MPDPLLNPAWYSKIIPEGIASLNKTVIIVNATDADQGMNGMIEYSIDSGNEKGFFTIDHDTVSDKGLHNCSFQYFENIRKLCSLIFEIALNLNLLFVMCETISNMQIKRIIT